MLEEETWKAWLDHPVTQVLREYLRKEKHSLQERWSAGEFTDMSHFGTAILNAKAVGQCEVIENLLDFDYEKLLTEIDDE